MTEQEKQEAYQHKFELIQAMAELSSKEKEIKSSQGYGKAYLLSILIPPIGIFYFIKYIFFNGGEKESVKAGIISLILTMASLFLTFWSMAYLFKQTTSTISPSDMQSLKDLTVPDNQKQILQLFK